MLPRGAFSNFCRVICQTAQQTPDRDALFSTGTQAVHGYHNDDRLRLYSATGYYSVVPTGTNVSLVTCNVVVTQAVGAAAGP